MIFAFIWGLRIGSIEFPRNTAVSEMESKTEEKFQIDLMVSIGEKIKIGPWLLF